VELDRDVEQGIKRKHDDEDDSSGVDELELEDTLLRTCISKLSTVTTANGLRRRRTLRHMVLINNMLQSLKHPDAGKPQNSEPQRARVTARRHSSENSTGSSRGLPAVSSTPAELLSSSDTDYSVVMKQEPQESSSSSQKHQQSLEHPPCSWEQKQLLEQLSLPWEPQQQLELLPLSLDTDNTEVMSSPTTTFCPLIAVDLTLGLVSSLSYIDSSQSELATLDISCDYNPNNTAVNFYESLPFYKPATLASDSTVLGQSGSGFVSV